MTKIAVIGPGAIGGTVAAWLAASRAGNEVMVCARTAFDQLRVEVPEGRILEPRVRVVTWPDEIAPGETVDWAVVTTKTYDNAGTVAWLERIVGPSTIVVVMQNGVEHMTRFGEAVVPSERTLPSIIDIPAERTGPGRILQRRHGDVTVPAGGLGRRFAALFAGTPLNPIVSADFTTAIWRKLALNSAGVVSALTLRPASVVQHPKAAELMRAIAAEAVLVGRAVGAKLEDSVPDHVLERMRASAPDSVNSLLADRLANRPMEIDARNGVIVRLGEAHRIPTPRNAMAVAILEASNPIPTASS